MLINRKQMNEIKQSLKKNDVKAIESVLAEIENKHRDYLDKYHAKHPYIKKQRKNGLTLKQKAQVERQRRLTDFEVKAIRLLYGTGKYSMRDLGAKYGVSRQTILNVIKGKMWYMKGENKDV